MTITKIKGNLEVTNELIPMRADNKEDANVIAFSFYEKKVQIISLSTTQPVKSLLVNLQLTITCVLLYATDRLILGCDDKSIQEWDLASDLCVRKLTGHSHWVRCLKVRARDEKGEHHLLVSGSNDHTIKGNLLVNDL